ncbi:MAG: histidine--tRNA ligase [Mycoplasma sp.]|nr:histidine--tRNA ligase [Mycoplasma sp.]
MQKPKGTKDIFGLDILIKQKIQEILSRIAINFNYFQIETPIFEYLEVFNKQIGENSEIVEKQMYVFKDKQKRLLVLRPEHTAAVLRAYIENKFFDKKEYQKLFYFGQTFRYENPQAGRQRQFNQFGVECFLEKNHYIDAEIIHLASNILKNLNIKYKLLINSFGNENEKKSYVLALKDYFSKNIDKLSNNSKKNVYKNPLRILDSKEKKDEAIIKSSPKINQYWSLETKEYFEKVLLILKQLNIEYEVDYHLVRGLDYYNGLIFEFLPIDNEKQQATIIGGGRYDNLINRMSSINRDTIGFAIGIERLIKNLDINQFIEKHQLLKTNVFVYIINLLDITKDYSFKILNILRENKIHSEINHQIKPLKKLLDKYDSFNPTHFIIIGKNEFETKTVTIKKNQENITIKIDEITNYFKNQET